MTNNEYHSKKDHISASGLKMFVESPLYWKHYQTTPFEQTPAMINGTAVHDLIEYELTGDKKIIDKYGYFDELEHFDESEFLNKNFRRTKAYQDVKKDIFNSGKIIVDKFIFDVVKNLFRQKPVVELLKTGAFACEKSYFVEIVNKLGKGEKIKVRTRPDYENFDNNFILDYKTISKYPNIKNCQREITDRKYYIQVGLYSLVYFINYGKYPDNFYFLFISTTTPFDYNIIEVDSFEIATCIDLVLIALNDYYFYTQQNYFPSVQKYQKTQHPKNYGSYSVPVWEHQKYFKESL